MADVHPQGDLRLPAVAAEVALTDQQPDDQPLLDGRELERGHGPSLPARPHACFTGQLAVSRWTCLARGVSRETSARFTGACT